MAIAGPIDDGLTNRLPHARELGERHWGEKPLRAPQSNGGVRGNERRQVDGKTRDQNQKCQSTGRDGSRMYRQNVPVRMLVLK